MATEKAVFAIEDGLYQYIVLPFILHGAQPHFKDRWTTYIDDVVIFSLDYDSHLQIVKTVLYFICMARLTINHKNYTIDLEEAQYLGYTNENF